MNIKELEERVEKAKEYGEEFSVFLLNQAISCFPLNSWGARIKVKTTGKNIRPTVDVSDFIEQLQNAGDDYPSVEEFEKLRNGQK
jgi:hypothetical protein